jgi:hypothetical protein
VGRRTHFPSARRSHALGAGLSVPVPYQQSLEALASLEARLREQGCEAEE